MQDISRDVITKAAQGDIGAFEQIYKETCGFVYNVAYRTLSNKEETQEITQDVFMKIHDNLKDFQFGSSLKTWIYRITVNTAINAAKKRAKDMDRRVDYDDTLAEQPIAEALKKRLDQEENEVLVNRLLNALTPEHRTCVVLKDIQGLSYEEIASALKININTVRSRLSRARETLLKFSEVKNEMR